MLSYRHGFHAGNAADVLKHIVLMFCLNYLTQKEKALLCIDTHAGAGAFPLNDNSREWEPGIGRLLKYAAENKSIPGPAANYLKIIGGQEGIYPGSPLLAAKLLREQDRLVCFELHPEDAAGLEMTMESYRILSKTEGKKIPLIEVRREDGPLLLKSLLPPVSGRGLIFIDPSWEEKDEYIAIPEYIKTALKRFNHGTYIIWYPLLIKPKLQLPKSESAGSFLINLYNGNRCMMELSDLSIGINKHSPRGMYGSGMVIYNPPWTLDSGLKELLPFLAGILMDRGKWNLEWKNS